jgi:hypothetical protein
MKVIGTVPHSVYSSSQHPDYLVQVSHHELQMLSGGERISLTLSPGTEIEVSKRFHRLEGLIANRAKLESVISQLGAVAEILKPLKPLVDGGELPPTPEGVAS